jgi:hypothetical protein
MNDAAVASRRAEAESWKGLEQENIVKAARDLGRDVEADNSATYNDYICRVQLTHWLVCRLLANAEPLDPYRVAG